MDIVVYFNSGNKARFDTEKTAFMDANGDTFFDLESTESIDQFRGRPSVRACKDQGAFLQGGGMLINWANVCFVRRFEEPREDEEP